MTVRIRRASATRGYRHLIGDGKPGGRFLGSGLALLRGPQPGAQDVEISAETFVFLLGTAAARVGGDAITGFDVTFSLPKSASIAWGLADATTQATIHGAHAAAVDHTLHYAERSIFAGRGGADGPVAGVIGAAFDHWESRAGDPQLHTHVVIPCRAQRADGSWCVIESRGLGEEIAALSELHDGIFSDLMAARLGWAVVPSRRTPYDLPRYEIDGVDAGILREFSTSSAQIQTETDALIDDTHSRTGQVPTPRDIHRLRHTATLRTRPERQLRTLADLVDDWRERARPLVGAHPEDWVRGLGGRVTGTALRRGDLTRDELRATADRAVAAVSARRSSATYPRVVAEVRRQLRQLRFAGPEDRIGAVDDVLALLTHRALSAA